ncbi:MAG: carbamoyltransferase HypF [Pelosinus sp.]|nr:carbamoyltransferase HypF [Pelosinus sp.]
MNDEAWHFKLFGIVQGVGFRPFIHRLAKKCNLSGWVNNSASGLEIWTEGEKNELKLFKEGLLRNPPPSAQIERYEITVKAPAGYTTFSINASDNNTEGYTFPPPDTGICEQCLKEFSDPKNRRYKYLMTTCAECGPRFSIIHSLPYDRESTAMKTFTLCPVCNKEYNDIQSRRYHTEAIACPVCGPRVWLVDESHNTIQQPINELLKLGKIIAIKGIGGFHLACDALNETTIWRLRSGKKRNDKPFAIMCRDLAAAKEYCQLNAAEIKLLTSSVKPIVLLQKRSKKLPYNITHGLNTIGVMLPYTALHHALFDTKLNAIVLTSANLSDDPLIVSNQAALEKLHGIADFFLFHNRVIINSCDDSVAAVIGSDAIVYRRSRGYVPVPLSMKQEHYSVLACGGDLKSTFCILTCHHAFLSQYFGDLANYENYRRYLKAVSFYKKITKTKPIIVAHDLHPGYTSTAYAQKLEDVFTVGVQHHHAHFASCIAENNISRPILGVVCDGTGYGTDGAMWGFEFMYGDYQGFERLAHLEYLALPGGDTAVANPSHTALSYLYHILGHDGLVLAKALLPRLTNNDITTLEMQLDQSLGVYNTSSCGRLFDAVAALLGLCTTVSYEGQAAMLLEAISYKNDCTPYGYELLGEHYPYQLAVNKAIKEILLDVRNGVAKEIIGGRFHATVSEIIVATVSRLSHEKECRQVALSGGVFQNRILIESVMKGLKNKGIDVFIQRKVPTNDGGLALGQALIGEEVYKRVSRSSRQGTQN